MMEREDAAAVVMEQCTKLRHMTMYLKICAVLVPLQIFSGIALAVDDKQPAGGPPAGRHFPGHAGRTGRVRAGLDQALSRCHPRYVSAFWHASNKTVKN